MSSNPFEPGSPTDELLKPKKRSFTLVEFLTVLAIIGVLVGLLLPVRRTAREAARRMQCANNLKQLALAMQLYHDHYKSFPPAYTTDGRGKRLHSWRTLLLPYLEENALYSQIDLSKAWDDPANIRAADGHVPSVYLCASNSGQRKTLYQSSSIPRVVFPARNLFRAGKSPMGFPTHG